MQKSTSIFLTGYLESHTDAHTGNTRDILRIISFTTRVGQNPTFLCDDQRVINFFLWHCRKKAHSRHIPQVLWILLFTLCL